MAKSNLYEIFSRALDIPVEEITDKLTYNTSVKWDSTAHLGLIAELEDSFGIVLEMDDILDMSSVAKAKEILARYDVVIDG
jgi:acyl carrier protein